VSLSKGSLRIAVLSSQLAVDMQPAKVGAGADR